MASPAEAPLLHLSDETRSALQSEMAREAADGSRLVIYFRGFG